MGPPAADQSLGRGDSREADLWQRLRAGFDFVECEPRASMQASLRGFTAHPHAFNRMVAHATPQLDYVTRRLEEAGIPAEFALLPMVESRYLVYSPRAGARGPAGPWQLMPRTARAFGLVVSREFDARLDLIASTDAAILLLRSLHDQFEDWTLVNLAFNAGDGRVRGAIRREGGWRGDAYSLPLSSTTHAHYSRLRALVCICIEPERYGLSLPPSPAIQLHRESLGADRRLAHVAQSLGLSLDELLRFNPVLAGRSVSPVALRGVLVPRAAIGSQARIPEGNPALSDLPGPPAVAASPSLARTHTVTAGDSLWLLARRYRIALDNLRLWNALPGRALIRPGQVLRLTAP